MTAAVVAAATAAAAAAADRHRCLLLVLLLLLLLHHHHPPVLLVAATGSSAEEDSGSSSSGLHGRQSRRAQNPDELPPPPPAPSSSLPRLLLHQHQHQHHDHYYELHRNNQLIREQLPARARALDALGTTLKGLIHEAKNTYDHWLELVFLIDASASVGETNFRRELGFVRKLLHYFETDLVSSRVSIVTFAGRGQIVRHVDYVSGAGQAAVVDKCQSLRMHLDNVTYIGGGTYTYGALMEALDILETSKSNAKKVVFLITDGFSNGNDPRHAASLLKKLGVTIITFGINTGNVDELRDIASTPSYAHSYFINSYLEFETLARKALHKDLKANLYIPTDNPNSCKVLCDAASANDSCCDTLATCSCSTTTGNYACTCPPGYRGNGVGSNSCQPCPNGTYGLQNNQNNLMGSCVPCPDANHVTVKTPAVSISDCVCTSGFTNERGTCEAITCSKLKVPENGYFVNADVCNNVVNAACGVRCRIGFHLTGDSIRLCGQNGSWTGDDTQCLLKTCTALRAPANGRIKCVYENDKKHGGKIGEKAVQPIDTRCHFKCDNGYQLRGSKVRNCLPLARWDGLKATCKPIYCEALRPVANAETYPKSCVGTKKLSYGTNCTIHCKKGYKLEGPKVRTCIGRHGTWSKRHVVNRCIDKMRPTLTCPENMTVPALPGKNYAFVSWPLPNVTDNSGLECNVWSKPLVTFPWRARIGKHVVRYIAQDVSGNKARCLFHVTVIDQEEPQVENCEDNQLFLSGSEKNLHDIHWDEPIFYDNSGLSVKVNKTFQSASEYLVGKHSVLFDAVDKYGNVAICYVNLTLKDACDDVPKPLNGAAQCFDIENNGGKQCILYCDDGFAFALDAPAAESKNQSIRTVVCNSTHHFWSSTTFQDCSPVKVPDTVSHEESVILSGVSVDCDNATLMESLTRFMNKSYNFNVISLCGNELECETKKKITCGLSDLFDQSYARHKRDSRKNSRQQGHIEIKFTLLAKIIAENENNTRRGIIKLKDQILSMTNSGELNLLDETTSKEIRKLGLNLHRIFKDPLEICKPGSILKKNSCLKCPPATFHNVTKGQCQPCPIGEYQDDLGTTQCKKCPLNFYTRRTHAKSAIECIPACSPGYYSRRKQHPDLLVSLVPCVSCEIGYYQPRHGQNQCFPCPRNTLAERRAASAASDCLIASSTTTTTMGHYADNNNSCKIAKPCLNRATCVKEKNGFSCDCRNHYVGSRCEKFVNPCLSSPCSSAGQCVLRNSSDDGSSFYCACSPGYTGTYCETLINECSYSPCRNGGTCSSTETDFTCTCKEGFEGNFCEIAVNHCSPSPCEMNSTCHSVDGSWKCFCQPGYLGLRCNLMPCDWLPCEPNEICFNLVKVNADTSDYRCKCPPGYTGRGCLNRIDHCQNHSCQNNGTCISHLTNYTCKCPVPFSGSRCEIELSSNYVMHFTRSSKTDYVIIPGPYKNLSELTVCFWLRTNDTYNYGTVLSYATADQDNAFTITDYNGFVLYVNGEKVISEVRINDGYWHFVCVFWENQLGSWQFFVDGALKDNGTFLARNSELQAGGTFVLGQEQDEIGGGFSETESLVGKLTLLDIWDYMLDPDLIKSLSNSCDKYYGSLVAWVQMREHMRGSIQVISSSFCQSCPAPVPPFNGYVNVTDEGLTAIYSCENGYGFRINNEHSNVITRKCLKYAQWESHELISCLRIRCPAPGYFPRGQIVGRSYLYSDKITYQCNEGYYLKGNVQRICKGDGKWSGGAPLCIGVTCKNLLAPDNGDIEYIVPEHDRDDLSMLQVGYKLEFKCNLGYFLSGPKILTCLKNGSWDFERPICVLMGCQPPKTINNGHILVNISSISDKTVPYFYGDIVSFACDDGYKFAGNNNLIAEFKVQCSADGNWKGFVPDCVSL